MEPFHELVRVMARLRSAKGCPWDRRQTHRSLLKYLDEEAREFKASVRKRDWANMEEELGDLLLQVVFHAQLAAEKRRFRIDHVVRTLVRKLKLRHPHVFGYQKEHRRLLKGRTLSLRTEEDVLRHWSLLKTIPVRSPRRRKR